MHRDYNFLSESVDLSANQICGQAGWRQLPEKKIQPKTELTSFFFPSIDQGSSINKPPASASSHHQRKVSPRVPAQLH